MSLFDCRYYFSWDGRINRRDFFLGQQLIGLALFFPASAIVGASVLLPDIMSEPFSFYLFLALAPVAWIPFSSLWVRRAHDLGWSALYSLLAFLTPLAIVLTMLVRFGAFGRSAADLALVQVVSGPPLSVVAFVAGVLVGFWLMLKKGQPDANRYGPAPPDAPLVT